MTDKKKARSSELTGGEGFTYEDSVAVLYLTALLRQEAGPATRGAVVRVAVQQKRKGEPLDDLIVDAEDTAGRSRLSLQVKRSVTATSKNADMREILREAVETRAKPDFRVGVDRYGFATRKISIDGLEALTRIIGFATASTNGEEFDKRFSPGSEANAGMIGMRDDLKLLIAPTDSQAEWEFYRHFVALRLDGLGEDEDRAADVRNRLNEVAPFRDANLMAVLAHEVRKGEGKAKVWTRNALIADLRGKVRLRVAPTFDHDVRALSDLARAYVREIRADIAGISLDRHALVEAAENAAASRLYSNINGQPGCGKSVILRRCVERALARGPVLFLKSDRLEGASWRSFAQAQGLQTLEAAPLLGEIGGAGTPTLFIDGIDRIKAEHKGIITDLLTVLQSSPELSHWHVLVTSRDQGLEPLRSWIPSSFYASTGIGDVLVGSLSDDEAIDLAEQRPELRPLLMSDDPVEEIARRPFFAAVLADQAGQIGFDKGPPPQTETELIDAWWRAGGYDTDEHAADLRQHALLDLAEVGAPSLGKGIAGRRLAASTKGQLEALRKDRIIEVVVPGSRYQFSHDIFFEWSFFRLLIDQGDDWPDALIAAGEPPLLARIVGLLSQHAYEEGQGWRTTFRDLEGRPLRPQWRRSWLLGPASSTKFADNITQFQGLLEENGSELLSKFLLWFQAERTIPNPIILKTPLPGVENAMIVRGADMLGWPSDAAEWRRVLSWLFSVEPALPAPVIPAVVELFEVWQNMLADHKNLVSSRIIAISSSWLLDLEGPPTARWSGLRDDARTSLADTLRKLLLRAARAYPAPAEAILDRVTAYHKRPDEVVKTIYGLSGVLADVFPDKLAALLSAEVLEELPKDKHDRKEREARARYARIKAIRDKPESERSDDEQRMLDHLPMFHPIGSDRYDSRQIGIGREHGFFYPAATGHEPFDSLFRAAPDVARRLVRDMSNHAIRGWLQVHELHRQDAGTPLSLTIDFPWGPETFWGDARVYSWFYGDGAPQALGSAFLSFSLWAHQRREAGDDLEMLLRQVLEGQTSLGAVGLAVSLAIESNERTPTLLALLKAQRLWHLDVQRQVQEAHRGITFMGMTPTTGMNAKQKEAHDYLMGRAYRHRSLKDLSYLYALAPDAAERTAFNDALKRFPEDLPYEKEEDREHPGAKTYLLERAEAWSRFGDKAHYAARTSTDHPDRIEIAYRDPIPPSEATQKQLEESANYLRERHVTALIMTSLANGQRDDRLITADVVAFAKTRDAASLFKVMAEAGSTMTQSCVSASACLIIRFGGSAEETAWAWTVLDRVAGMDAGPNEDSHSEYNMDPRIFLMVALKVDIASGDPRPSSVRQLFECVGARNLYISQGALTALLDASVIPLAVTWNAAILASDLFAYPIRDFQGRDLSDARQGEHVTKALKRALTRLEKANDQVVSLTSPPPAWERVTDKPRRRVKASYPEETWTYPAVEFNAHFAAQVVGQFAVEAWLASEAHRPYVLSYVKALVTWTSERLFPHFAETDRDNSANLYEWTAALGRLAARISLEMPLEDCLTDLVKPIAGKGRRGRDRQYLSELTDAVTRRYIYDAKTLAPGALSLLDALMTLMLEERDLSPTAYRAGEIKDRELREMIKSFLLTSATDCKGATRFANGDWTDLPRLLPQIERLMSAVGWADAVMDQFLLLIRRAPGTYPIKDFSTTVLQIFDGGNIRLERWNSGSLPALLSGAIQALADANQPLGAGDARDLLIILDRLVDMGDRRASALQQSEHFRGIQIHRVAA